MEINEAGNPGGVGGGVAEYWYWGGISSAQLLWAISSFRKGYAGDGHLMPFKAFAVASLFVGAAASATVGCLRASGIRSFLPFGWPPHCCAKFCLFLNLFLKGRKVEDMKIMGANIRAGLGISPRARDE